MSTTFKFATVLCLAVMFGMAVSLTYATPSQGQASESDLPACAPGLDEIDANDLPSVVDLDDCPVDGREIVDGEVSAVVPDPGEGVYAEALTTEGAHELVIEHDKDGTIELSEVGVDLKDGSEDSGTLDQEASTDRQAASIGNGCRTNGYDSLRFKMGKGESYRFNKRTTPRELSRRQATGAIRRGTANIYKTKNPCRLGDRVPVAMSYKGKTSRRADVGFNNCEKSDDRNVASFGRLPRGTLAVTCTTFSGGIVVASDMEINKRSVKWTTRPHKRSCKRQFDLESVVTHERGHTFGLGHVPESKGGTLTMSVFSEGPCQDSERSLGRGDVLGLGNQYR